MRIAFKFVGVIRVRQLLLLGRVPACLVSRRDFSVLSKIGLSSDSFEGVLGLGPPPVALV